VLKGFSHKRIITTAAITGWKVPCECVISTCSHICANTSEATASPTITIIITRRFARIIFLVNIINLLITHWGNTFW